MGEVREVREEENVDFASSDVNVIFSRHSVSVHWLQLNEPWRVSNRTSTRKELGWRRLKARSEVGESGEHAEVWAGRSPKGQEPWRIWVFVLPHLGGWTFCYESNLVFGDQGDIVTGHCPQMLPPGGRQETIQFRFFWAPTTVQGPKVPINFEIPGMELEVIPWSSFVFMCFVFKFPALHF